MGYCEAYESTFGKLPFLPSESMICKGGGALKDAAKDIAASAWRSIVDSFAEAATTVVTELTTFWFKVTSPTLKPNDGPIEFLFDSIWWITSALAVLALLVAAGRLAWERRAEPARDALAAVIRLVLSAGAIVTGVNLLVAGGDEFSRWIIQRSTSCDGAKAGENCVEGFGNRIASLTTMAGTLSLGLILVLSLLLLLGSLVQIIFMLARNAMLIVLVGTLPLAAAVSSTQQGRAWFHKATAWLIAFVLYKPAAAIVYAAGFAMIGASDHNEVITQISGVMLLVLAALTLPALMRVATPLVESVASGGGGGGSALAAGRSIASGALAVKTGGASKAAAGAAKGAGKAAGKGAASGSLGKGAAGGGSTAGSKPPSGGGPAGGGTSAAGGSASAGGRAATSGASGPGGAPPSGVGVSPGSSGPSGGAAGPSPAPAPPPGAGPAPGGPVPTQGAGAQRPRSTSSGASRPSATPRRDSTTWRGPRGSR